MRFISAVRRNRKLQLAFALSALALAAAAVILVHDYVERRRYHHNFLHHIETTDRLLAEDLPEQAESRLKRAAEFARGEQAWMRVLKRAYRIEESRGTAGTMLALARLATEAEPRVQALEAVAVQAAVRAGAYQEAAERAQTHLHAEEHASVRAEAVIAAGAYPSEPSPDELEAMHPLVRLVVDATPERHLRAYDLTTDPRFAVNAALLYLSADRAEQAQAVLEGIAVPDEAGIVGALVAYELGEYQEARSRLRRLPGEAAVETPALLLHAELELRTGRLEEARRVYRELQTADPDHSAAAWYNYAALIDDRSARREVLADALQRFPQDLRLVNAYVEAGGDEEAVLGGLEPAYRALFRFQAAESESSSGARAVSRLWDLHNEYPRNEEIAAALARRLAAVRDRSGLERVIGRFADARVDGDSASYWAAQYAGVLAHGRGDRTAAAEAFESGFAPRRLWQSAHNRAIIAVLDRDAAGVAEALAPALSALEGIPGHGPERGRLLHLRAMGAYLAGDAARAREFALEGVAEDRDNFELRRFLRNLETAMQ